MHFAARELNRACLIYARAHQPQAALEKLLVLFGGLHVYGVASMVTEQATSDWIFSFGQFCSLVLDSM